jgi:hypothetical protein
MHFEGSLSLRTWSGDQKTGGRSMARSWTTIDIQRRLPSLVDDLMGGDVTLFVGADLSQNAGLPSWDEVMFPLARELGLEAGTSPISIARYYVDAHVQGRYLLNRHIIRQLRRVPTSFSLVHALIRELPCRAIVTTNLDDLIEKALSREPEKPYQVIVNDEDLSYHSGHDLPVLKVNGCINRPNSLVLTRRDFERYESQKPVLTTYVKNLMATSTLLYVGTSVKDPGFAAFSSGVLDQANRHRRAFYSIVASTNKYEAMDFRDRGIELIDLESEPEEFSDSLAGFLESLVRALSTDQQPGRITAKAPGEGSLLISRLGPGLSLEVDPEQIDSIHGYSLVERTDLLDYDVGDFVSIRRLTGTNQSDLLSASLVYSEASEKKISYSEIKIVAYDIKTRKPLIVESLDGEDIQMLRHGYRILFNEALSPNESFDIVYRIVLPGELSELSRHDEVMSISLARITRSIEKLRFNVCLNFRPRAVAMECLDSEGNRIATEGAAPKIEKFEPQQWYEHELNIAWRTPASVIRWEKESPDSKLYIVNYRT